MLLLTFAVRAVRPDQPIVENYVGRQVPTAMVARNLDRGSGFLRPQLDTGPFPDLFLVEPPVYAALVVGLHRLTGLAIGPAGRIISALATTLAAWGLFGLVRRREGPATALLAVLAFALLPVTIRYGRAVQPDALLLGLTVAGLRLWADGGRARLVAGWLMLSVALAVKVIAAPVLIPLAVLVQRPVRPWKVALVVAALGPALLWYVHAGRLLAGGGGSRASLDNASFWAAALGPRALLKTQTYAAVARFVAVRAFTPLGFGLALVGLGLRPGVDRLWRAWALAAAIGLSLVAGKLHHEYYFLALVPVVAVGIGRALSWDRRSGIPGALALAALAAWQSAATWRTPAEWRHLGDVAAAIREHVPIGALIVAPEAVLYAADRRGCRLEPPGPPARRAAGEWGGSLDADDPISLVDFYGRRGARYVADVWDDRRDPAPALHAAIRLRYSIVVDRPGYLLAALDRPGEGPHAQSRRVAPDAAGLPPPQGRRPEDRRADGL